MTTPVLNLDPISQVHGALLATRDELKSINDKLDGHNRLFHGNGDWAKGVFGQLQAIQSNVTAIKRDVEDLKNQRSEDARMRLKLWIAVLGSGTSLAAVVWTSVAPALMAWLAK